ncbi:MAG TPA: hypothetical protein VNP95_00880, partial [Thermomicrobiales bacterium]|nr:hypothetical protein [Thermomicrobiales bacterium]
VEPDVVVVVAVVVDVIVSCMIPSCEDGGSRTMRTWSRTPPALATALATQPSPTNDIAPDRQRSGACLHDAGMS